LLLKIRDSEIISWKGHHRAAINNLGVYPRPVQKQLPVWIAVGGTPQSVSRAAKLGLPLALAIIGGNPAQFRPLIQHYKNSYKEAGHGNTPQVGINTHVFIAEDSSKASDTFFPSYADAMTRIGRERGWSGMTREHYDAMRAPGGSLMVGSPDEVIEKILYEYELFGFTRFLAQMSVGSLPHAAMMKSIELFATVVVPAVKKHLKDR
ncbi:MAG: LLM class flavin-dependent oxidoreductase, partial [Bacteroidia bacterium]